MDPSTVTGPVGRTSDRRQGPGCEGHTDRLDRDRPQLSATGEFHVQEGHALIGRDHVAATDLAAVILVETGRVRISKIAGNYGTMQLTDGKADVSFLDAGPWLDLEMTSEMGPRR